MNDHTPGPWTVIGNSDLRDREIVGANETAFPLAVVPIHPTAGAQRANAALISSAPDLLEALRELVRAWDGSRFPPTDERIEMALHGADIAIAKAEGRG
jgi:hypothetical protein